MSQRDEPSEHERDTRQDDAGGLLEKTREQMQLLVEDVKDNAARVVAETRAEAAAIAERRQQAAADELGDVATALRAAAERLDERARHGLGHYAQRWATQVEDAAAYLRNQPPAAMVEDLRRLARRRPELFVAGSLITGVVVARLLRSSTARRRRPVGLHRTVTPLAGRTAPERNG